MATPINAPLTSEIWHLSIDDLLEPMTETPRLGGPGPFVINLSASSAPLCQPASDLAAGEGVHVYQIHRMEDRRPRYRLRLGPFLTEDEADAVLKRVRDCYPSALTATAEADDLKAITALKPRSASAPVPSVPGAAAQAAVAAQRARAASLVPAASLAPAAPPVPAAAPRKIESAAQVAPRPAPAVARAMAPTPSLAFAARPAPVKAVPAAAPVAAPVPPSASIPVLSDCVEPARRAAPKAPAPAPIAPKASAVPQRPAAQGSPPTLVAAPRAAAPTPAMAGPPAKPAPRGHANFEATQTLRPLTPAELQESVARWYVIQLSLSEESFDPDSLPNLDIFSEYRLYSVAGIDQGRIMHALRLGFFTDEVAAAAVASYLGGFYEKPIVKRISVAERERFRDQRVEARKDIGATGRHAIIEITGERHIRDKALRVATVTPLAPQAAAAQAAPARR